MMSSRRAKPIGKTRNRVDAFSAVAYLDGCRSCERQAVKTRLNISGSASRNRRWRHASLGLVVAAGLAWSAGRSPIRGEQEDQPVEFTHNVNDAPAPVAGGVFGSGPAL